MSVGCGIVCRSYLCCISQADFIVHLGVICFKKAAWKKFEIKSIK